MYHRAAVGTGNSMKGVEISTAALEGIRMPLTHRFAGYFPVLLLEP